MERILEEIIRVAFSDSAAASAKSVLGCSEVAKVIFDKYFRCLQTLLCYVVSVGFCTSPLFVMLISYLYRHVESLPCMPAVVYFSIFLQLHFENSGSSSLSITFPLIAISKYYCPLTEIE